MPSVSIPVRRRLVRLGVAVPLAALLLGAPAGPRARASLGACGSDPVASLSNGVTVDLSATIDDSASDVAQVAYTLHAPAGTTLTGWVPTSGPLGPAETLAFVADLPPGAYDTTTKVSTLTSGIAVSVRTSVIPPVGAAVSASTTGKDQQALPLQLSL